MKEKIGFLAFHILFAISQITMSVLGFKLISFVFYIAGGAVILFGLLSFLPGTKFWIVEGKYGYYEANNVKSSLITMGITILIGVVIAVIPQYLNDTGLFVPIFSYLVALFVGLKIMSENSKWADSLNLGQRWIGKLVPVMYILSIFIMILPLLNPMITIDPVVSIVLMSVAGAFHLFRTIIVMVANPFWR